MAGYSKKGQCLHKKKCTGCPKKFVVKYHSDNEEERKKEFVAGVSKPAYVCLYCEDHPCCGDCFIRKQRLALKAEEEAAAKGDAPVQPRRSARARRVGVVEV